MSHRRTGDHGTDADEPGGPSEKPRNEIFPGLALGTGTWLGDENRRVRAESIRRGLRQVRRVQESRLEFPVPLQASRKPHSGNSASTRTGTVRGRDGIQRQMD